jgi:hypothetical protein
MPAVILHIGLPKTGTTYLQEWLKLNASILEQYGRKIVPSLLAHRLAVGAIKGATRNRRDISDILSKADLQHALTEASHDGAVLSSEYFSVAKPQDVAQLLAQSGLSIAKTIIYLRRQDHLCAAGYAQAIKMLGVFKIPDNVIDNKDLDWNFLERKWKAVSRDVIFVNYDLHKADLPRSFLEAIGAPGAPTIKLASQINVSLTAEMTEIARLLNQSNIPYDVDRLSAIEGWYPNIPFSFSPRITTEFEKVYLQGNQKFARKHPDEFGSFAIAGWKPLGQDMAGRIGEDHLADVMRHLAGSAIPGLARSVQPASGELPSLPRRVYLRAQALFGIA